MQNNIDLIVPVELEDFCFFQFIWLTKNTNRFGKLKT